MPHKSSGGEDTSSFYSADGDGVGTSRAGSNGAGSNGIGSRASSNYIDDDFPRLRRLLPKNKRRRLSAFVVVILVLLGSSYSVGYVVSENQHPLSLVDQAIARVSTGDPHSPTEILLQRAAIEAVLKATKDKWSNYFPPASAAAFDETLQGRYSGIGIWLRRNPLNQLEISSVQPNSPASLAGIKVLDQLLSVDGVNVSEATVADAIAALRGSASTMVALGLRHNGVRITLNIMREAVLTGDVLASQIAAKTLYIQVSAISSHAAEDVSTALAKYPHSHGVILDLRDNPIGVCI